MILKPVKKGIECVIFIILVKPYQNTWGYGHDIFTTSRKSSISASTK